MFLFAMYYSTPSVGREPGIFKALHSRLDDGVRAIVIVVGPRLENSKKISGFRGAVLPERTVRVRHICQRKEIREIVGQWLGIHRRRLTQEKGGRLDASIYFFGLRQYKKSRSHINGAARAPPS